MSDNLAHEYALGIYEDLKALELITTAGDDVDRLPKDLEPEERANVWRFIENYGDYFEEIESFLAVYFYDVLEIKRTYSGATNSAENLAEVSLVVTVGGPHAEIVFDGSEFASVEVFWGSQRAQMSVQVPEIVSYVFDILAEGF